MGAFSAQHQRLAEDARAIFVAAADAVGPETLIGKIDLDLHLRRPLSAYNNVWVLGMGKGALALACVLEQHLGDRIDGGFVATVRGYPDNLPARYTPPQRIEVGEGGHPFPDAGSVRNARRILRLAREAGSDDLVLTLVTGGGSSVCADFAPGISLDDALTTTRLLLEAGVDIHSVNLVRKQLSRIADGRLARTVHPAEALVLVVSDVVGDDLEVIASGPMVDCSGSREAAMALLRDAKLWSKLPRSVRGHLEHDHPAAIARHEGEPPHVTHLIIGSNETALQGAAAAAREMGYVTEIKARNVSGEAREVAGRLLTAVMSSAPAAGHCFLAGGETTVTVRGRGRGGSNQEMALAAAILLDEWDSGLTFLSGGTDGIDGLTDAAGAVVSRDTCIRARELGIDPLQFLDNNDSHTFFEQVGGLIRTGPTHTNVMDVQVILTGPPGDGPA